MNKEKFACFSPGLVGACLFIFIAWGCVQKPVKIIEGPALLIQSKALIKNDNETNNIKIEMAVLPQKAVRMEITATLGVSVATVLMTPGQIVYALHGNKEFVKGPFHEKTFYPIFKKNIDPRLIWKIIPNESPASQNLKCDVNSSGKPIKCLANDGFTISWIYAEKSARRIDLKSNRFEMSWIFKDENSVSQYQNETFVLKKPEGYKEIIIK